MLRRRPLNAMRELGISDALIDEQGYLVSRGARPLALVGTIENNQRSILRAYMILKSKSFGSTKTIEPIPVVIPNKNAGYADVGYAARAWVIETFKWVNENAPQPHLDRIIGVLLGYSPDAIAALDEYTKGMSVISSMAEE